MSAINFTRFGNVIAGQVRRSADIVGHAVNPSNRQPLWDIPIASDLDLEDAVTSAQNAFIGWSRADWRERQECLKRARDILQDHRRSMADLISTEGGKPLQFADPEVQHAIDYLNFSITSERPKPQVVQDDETLRLTLNYQPLGLAAAIVPWNFPLVLAVGKIAPALVAGNCIIVKPSPFTPYSITKFAELVLDVFPPGVFQALHGDNDLGPRICEHPAVRKISFTGSTKTGKQILSTASKSMKRVTLELGGNNASIVCKDVDVDIVAPQVALGASFNSGQLCVASKRIYVHKDIYDAFLAKMVETVKEWKVGPPTIPGGVMLGPVQNEVQYQKVKCFFKSAQETSLKFALGGGDDSFDDASFTIKPAIIDNPPDESIVVSEEAFGPIVPVQSWSDEQEVVRRANRTTTGLGGTVWSSDVEYAEQLGSCIDAGTVWINSFEKPLPQAYLEGRKESGLGGEWGTQGLLSWCERQVVHHYKSPVTSYKL